jgi:hypothetical protein
MNVAGFESKGYLGFVVSDLGQDTTLEIANALAPPLKAALESGSRSEARLDVDAVALVAETLLCREDFFSRQ